MFLFPSEKNHNKENYPLTFSLNAENSEYQNYSLKLLVNQKKLLFEISVSAILCEKNLKKLRLFPNLLFFISFMGAFSGPKV